ncbi:hypothetical protein SAMN02745775_11946 [Falsiroseomonas stagni DSM 19981]|uniref:Glycosyl transferase family 2 n=1 Tax=Falsiroseomonas stagni DSM 19981 TaxID=1123062 RepID=A0A1I4EWJ4_9PROT|nr:hypothetical protein SAMN02745775_11946 [Falsiroseomonas stagni DSM 19981]
MVGDCSLSPTLDALPAEGRLVAVLILALPGTPGWEASLGCIARQTVQPAEIIFAAQEAEGGGDLLPAGMSGSSIARCVAIPHTELLGARLGLLCNEVRSPLVAVLDTPDRWAPGYLRAAQDRFLAADAETLAAIAIPTRAAGGACPATTELHLEEALRGPGDTALGFIYRREALERVGGWDMSLGPAAPWDLQLRLLVEWHIGLLPATLAWREGTGGWTQPLVGAASRSRLLRRTLRRSPELIGLLMLQAHVAGTWPLPVDEDASSVVADHREAWAAGPA